MLRIVDIILITIMLVATAVTYKIKYDVEKQIADIRKLQHAIDSEKDMINLLKADWSFLIQPSRLQKLIETYHVELNLVPTDAKQVGSIDDIPERLVGPIETIIASDQKFVVDAKLETRKVTTDKIKMGSVRH